MLCTDPYVEDDSLVSLDRVLTECDLLIIGAPHRDYIDLTTDKPVADVWNLMGEGVRI